MPNLKNSLALWISDTSTAIGKLHDIKSMGFDRLIVRIVVHSPVPVAVAYQSANLKQLLADALTVGLAVDAWFYGYPTGITQQVSTIASILNAHPEISNVVMDMEAEWEKAAPGLADQFAHSLAIATNHRVAMHLSSFDNPSSHAVPYAAFLSHCEGFMPQSYQVDSTPVPLVMKRTFHESAPLAAGSLGKEFIPTVNTPAILAALAAAPGTATAVNVWCFDGSGVDMGILGHEHEWAPSIAAYKAAFK